MLVIDLLGTFMIIGDQKLEFFGQICLESMAT